MKIWVVEVWTGDDWVMAFPKSAYRTRVEARFAQDSIRHANEFVKVRVRAYQRIEGSK